MMRIYEPSMWHRFGRFLGMHFNGTRGIDRLLRAMHAPDRRHESWMETIARSIPDGPSFHLSTRWFPEWTTWFYGSVDEDIYQWIRRNAKPDWIAFDVGMNFGFFACTLAQRCRQSHGFEPVPWLADRAQANSDLNHFTNLRINRMALSNMLGEIDLFVPSQDDCNWGKSSLLRSEVGRGVPLHISMDTLDHYVSQNELNRLDFVKIDVEGAEHLVLQGAVESLKAFHSAIIFEANPESFEPSVKLLRLIGYKLFDLRGGEVKSIGGLRSHDVLAVY